MKNSVAEDGVSVLECSLGSAGSAGERIVMAMLEARIKYPSDSDTDKKKRDELIAITLYGEVR